MARGRHFSLLLLFAVLFSFNSFGQGAFCVDSDPFCTSETYTFPAVTGDIVAEEGPFYDCLWGGTGGSAIVPCPSWFHMRIKEPGDLQIKISNRQGNDIDFCCWGPYDDPTAPCDGQLLAGNVQDCSWDGGGGPEYCDIDNCVDGKYYILVLTNWSQSPCDISFKKTGGTAETDCAIVPPQIITNSPVCTGDDITLSTELVDGTTYNWTGPNGFTSSNYEVTIPNASLAHAGLYSLTITIDGVVSDPAEIEVVVNVTPQVNAGPNQNIWHGTTTTLSGSSATGGNKTYQWEPANKLVDATVLNPTTVNLTETTTFVLSITLEDGGCVGTDEVTVTIKGTELTTTATANVVQICSGNSVNITAETTGGDETYEFTWTSDPVGFTSDQQSFTVTPAVSTTYKVSVFDGWNTVNSEIFVKVVAEPVVDAGPDAESCGTSYYLSQNTASNYTSKKWTTLGSGHFNSSTVLHPEYFPSEADFIAGGVDLIIEVFTAAACPGPYKDTMHITFAIPPVVDLGPDTNLCVFGDVFLNDVSIANYTSITWTTSGNGSFDDATIEQPVYSPTAEDFANSPITLTALIKNPPCSEISETKILNLFTLPTLEAGADDTICESDTYTLAAATAANYSTLTWTTSGSGLFDDSHTMNAIYTPSLDDKVSGEIDLMFEAFTDAPCDGVFRDTLTLTIKREIIIDAGADSSLCGPIPHEIISPTGQYFENIVWTTSGTGTFVPNESDLLHPVYTPTEADVSAQSITLTATASNTHCPEVSDDINLTLFVIPLCEAGADATICSNQSLDIQDASVLHYVTLTWSSSGDGAFSDVNEMNPVYTPNTDDITNGSVTLRLEADT
ncbi:MAG: immunoglobulin domain-containing protein, partial [Bacteroidales bacterium]|nr:immunoglobulin domain-containing protein [Bacteroidales bacterium]